MKKILFWTPRILSVLFIAFISMFALDVFSEPQWVQALLIHLIPSFILIILTVVAWKKAYLGGILYIIFGLFILIFTNFEAYIIVIPCCFIGLLFIGERYINNRK